MRGREATDHCKLRFLAPLRLVIFRLIDLCRASLGHEQGEAPAADGAVVVNGHVAAGALVVVLVGRQGGKVQAEPAFCATGNY